MIKSDLTNAILRSDFWLESGIRAWLSNSMGEPSSIMFRKLKAICEIGYLEFFVNPLPNKIIKETILDLITKLVEDVRFKSLVRYGSEHSNLFIPILAIYLQSSQNNKETEIDVTNLIKLNINSSKERLPFREIDLNHILYKLTGEEKYFENILPIAKNGCIGKLKNLLSFSISDEYALTHTVFYLTDFGNRPWPNGIYHVSKLKKLINLLQFRAEENGDLDILGEYILCKQFLKCSGKELNQSLNILKNKEFNNEGYWKGPTELVKILTKEGFPSESILFFENYHTSIVIRLSLYLEWSNYENISIATESKNTIQLSGNFNKTFNFKSTLIEKRLQKKYQLIFRTLMDFFSQGNIIFESKILNDPEIIPLGLDLLNSIPVDKINLTEEVLKSFNEITSIAILENSYDLRFVRIWCVINIFLGNTSRVDFNKIYDKYIFKASPGVDKLILALITYDYVSKNRQRMSQELIHNQCAKVIISPDPKNLLYLLLYSCENPNLIEAYFDDLLYLFYSMNSITSSFGWLNISTGSDPNYLDVLSLITHYKLQAFSSEVFTNKRVNPSLNQFRLIS